MIPKVQIIGETDTHPEHPVHDAMELASGKISVSSLNVKEHHTRIFDLTSEDDRLAYDNLYVDLSRLSREGKILVSSNSREILTRSDGSTGWFRHLEWTVFDTSEILGA